MKRIMFSGWHHHSCWFGFSEHDGSRGFLCLNFSASDEGGLVFFSLEIGGGGCQTNDKAPPHVSCLTKILNCSSEL